MSDGILPVIHGIKHLQSLSPTRYTAFLECPLRAVWSANGAPTLLPVSPSARIGRIAHALLQEAGEGRFVSEGQNAVNDRWQHLVNTEESHMEVEWLDRHFIPLRKSVAHYEVRRIQSCNRAEEITSDAAVYKRNGKPVRKDEPGYGFEIPVSSRDGAIRGRIDAVLPTAAGPLLRDYKSGILFEEGGQGLIRQEYVIQLKLYAALYESTYGRWPSALEIVPLTGSAQAIEFDPSMCEDLLQSATDTLQNLNNTILGSKNATELERILAHPNARNCNYCQYRPGCQIYRRAIDVDPGEDWPKDIFGKVTLIEQLGNSRYMITVQTKAGTVRIRGVDPNLQRHPALGLLKVGDQIGMFSLSSNIPLVYLESPYTTLYKLE